MLSAYPKKCSSSTRGLPVKVIEKTGLPQLSEIRKLNVRIKVMSSTKFHWPRRAIQIATLLLIALIPSLGIFQIDLASASFHVLDRQIWWSNFAFISGLAIVVVTAPVVTYMTIGAVWCGWACPQNLVSEWANNLTYKFLGKRADVRVDGKGVVVAAAKNKLLNWLALGLIFLAASLVLALIPIIFFYPRSEVWEFITFRSAHNASDFLQFPYFFTATLIFIDIALVRYFFCDYACFYRMGQRMLKTQDALHVSYDASRAADCAKCNYCATSCITAIQPTDIKIYDPCIGCGECVDACNRLHEKTGESGLLTFEIGKIKGATTWRQKLGEIFSRFNWIVGISFLLGCAMMIWGIATQTPVESQASRDAQLKLQQISRVCNKQCAAIQSTCNGTHMDGCYLAAACKCDCSLQQDPANDSATAWHQCVQINTARADAFKSHKVPNQAITP